MTYGVKLYPISAGIKCYKPSEIKDVLKKLRLHKNFTQMELAARLEVSCTTISNYETGMRKCPPLAIEAWAKACGFTISFIVEENIDETKKA